MSTQSKAQIIHGCLPPICQMTAMPSRFASTEDFHFTSPYDDEIDKADLFRAVLARQ